MKFADKNKFCLPGSVIIVIFFIVCFLMPAQSKAQLIQNQSISKIFLLDTHGYATGQLSRVERENMFNRALNKAYIGQLLLGDDSASFVSHNGLPLELDNNPWSFCFDKDDFESIEDYIGKQVVVEFKTPRSTMLLSCSAITELISIELVTEDQFHNVTYFESNISTIGMDVAYGIEYGRITNAVKNKNTNREYYLTLQVGGRGSKFSHFVITDHDLYDFAVMNLKTGSMVKIHYKNRLNIRQTRNRLLIKGIETVDSSDEYQ